MQDKEYALEAGKDWADYNLRGFVEPERRRVPKGREIGFSRTKKKAALLMVVHRPSNGMYLRQIAKMAGTTEGVLKVWRTQKGFWLAERESIDRFSKILIRGIENEKISAGVAIYCNRIIQDRVATHFIMKCFQKNKDFRACFNLYNMSKAEWEAEGRSSRSWFMQKEVLDIQKDMMEVAIDGIISEKDEKLRAERGAIVKQVISFIFDVLGGKNSTLSTLAK